MDTEINNKSKQKPTTEKTQRNVLPASPFPNSLGSMWLTGPLLGGLDSWFGWFGPKPGGMWGHPISNPPGPAGYQSPD